MKSRRRHAAVDEVVDPSPFDYTLLSHLYVHSDGTDVIDYGGLAPGKESRGRVHSFLKNRSFAPGTATAAPEAVGSYLHLRVDEDDASVAAVYSEPNQTSGTYARVPPAHASMPASNLVRIEDKAEHWWFMCQSSEDTAPYARLFHESDDLLRYLEQHGMQLPTGDVVEGAALAGAGSPRGNGGGGMHGAPRQHNNNSVSGSVNQISTNTLGSSDSENNNSASTTPTLPLAKWLDIQVDGSNPRSADRLAKLLNLLPISPETRDSCLYLSTVDAIDINSMATGEVSDTMSGYVFLNLMCTPVVDKHGQGQGTDHAAAHSKHAESGFLQGLANGKLSFSHKDKHKRAKAKHGAAAAPRLTRHSGQTATRSVMEMRFEAVRTGAPRSSVPEHVAVAVIVFADWVVTIHEKPFAEMDDMLRMLQLHCAPPEVTSAHLGHNVLLSPTMRRRFTAPFAMSVLLQIVVGHYLDSITLAKAVDELGDRVFDIKEKQLDQDAVIKRITAVRRCFGECGTDTARREVLFASLLQPIFAGQFFVADPAIRRELENAQAHLWYFQREISDCRDTVAVSNWYHNVAIQWVLLRRGNRALRMVLLLTEMTNIMYPIIMVQTLYSMNVPVPFQADGDPPNNSLAPFFVLAALFLVYCSLTVVVIRSLLFRKPFETRLLA